MIKVIKNPNKIFLGTCKLCGCKFSYDITDLQKSEDQYIMHCPSCDEIVVHPDQSIQPTPGFMFATQDDKNESLKNESLDLSTGE